MVGQSKTKRERIKRGSNPHIYGAGTRLSSAYTHGRDGLPCPPYCADKTSHAYGAWKRGHDEFIASQRTGEHMGAIK